MNPHAMQRGGSMGDGILLCCMNLHPHAVLSRILWMWYSAASLYRKQFVSFSEIE
jgi:hypothetical protein